MVLVTTEYLMQLWRHYVGWCHVGRNTYEEEVFPNNFYSMVSCGGINKIPSATNYKPFYQHLATKIALIWL